MPHEFEKMGVTVSHDLPATMPHWIDEAGIALVFLAIGWAWGVAAGGAQARQEALFTLTDALRDALTVEETNRGGR